mgnify:CR=1 FL=1
MASTYLTKTLGTATNRKKFTISIWFKLGSSPVEQYFFSAGSSNNSSKIGLNGSGYISINQANSGTKVAEFQSDALLRDPASWYHLVVAYDTTLGTAADRQKVYLNGIQQTSFDTTNPPTDTEFTGFNNNIEHKIGTLYDNTSYFNGLMANVEFVDGQQLTPAYFGSTDSTTGIWTPQASSTISSYGTNGFKLKMDTATPGADTSGNTNTFTVGGGTPTLTQGSPSNVYATMNPLDNFYAGSTLSNGNNTVATVSSNAAYNPSNFAIKTGKWYWEVKLVACSAGNGSEATIIGMSNQSPTSSGYGGSIQGSGGLGIRGNGKMWAGGSEETGWSAIAVGNIAMIAVDFDNGKFYAGINGTWGNSGDPTSGSTGTGAYSFTVGSDVWFMAVNQRETSQTATFSLNFGEGFFGTTAAGTQADDNGQGLFAYDVPAGYYALNTKNLEAYG